MSVVRIDYRDLFLTPSPLQAHAAGYKHDPERYIATYMLLMTGDVHMDWKVKENVLCTVLIMKNEACINWLFSQPFWTIIDIRNVIRKLWTSGSAKSDTWLRSEMRNGRQIKTSRRDMLIYQIERMDTFKIERSILRHSYDVWREVIDYLHIPEKLMADYEEDTGHLADYYRMESAKAATDLEFPEGTPIFQKIKEQEKWMDERMEVLLKPHSQLMKTIMDGTWPPTHFIRIMRSVTKENAAEILSEFPAEFHYLRSKIDFEKNPDIAAAYLQKCTPANIIRWYDELWFPSTEPVISERMVNLSRNYIIHQPYSTYFDLLYSHQEMSPPLFEEILRRADEMTSRFNLPFPKPALIAVDQSSSMSTEQVKIGTVIANLIGQQLDADLVYFYGGAWSHHRSRSLRDGWSENKYSANGAVAEYEDVPLGTRGAIKLIDHHLPSGNTPIAQIMARYMTQTGSLVDGFKQIRTLVLVTDEGENGHWNNQFIAEALAKYRSLIGESIEVLIIAIQSDDTTVTDQLKAEGFPVIRYRIDSVRHIESLFAMIAANTPAFLHDSDKLTSRLKTRLHRLKNTVGLETPTDPKLEVVYVDAAIDMKKYKMTRDTIFASVIKGTCANCSANLPIKEVNRFRFGETIECDSCNFTLAPTLFGA